MAEYFWRAGCYWTIGLIFFLAIPSFIAGEDFGDLTRFNYYITTNAQGERTGNTTIFYTTEEINDQIYQVEELKNFDRDGNILLESRIYYGFYEPVFYKSFIKDYRKKYEAATHLDGNLIITIIKKEGEEVKRVHEKWRDDYVYFDMLPAFINYHLFDILSEELSQILVYSPAVLVATNNILKLVSFEVVTTKREMITLGNRQYWADIVVLRVNSLFLRSLLPKNSTYYTLAFAKNGNNILYYEVGGYRYELDFDY